MSDFVSKPPSSGNKASDRPETFRGGMMPVPERDVGLFVVDLRALELDKGQIEEMNKAIQKTVMEHLGRVKAPEKGLTRLGGHLAGIAVADI